MTREVHALVVAYHGAEDLDRCLGSLEGQIELTVVDNSSSREVRAVAVGRGARYLDSGANLGFGCGLNIALRTLAAGPPLDVLLLNPDAILAPPDLEILAGHLHLPGNQGVAAVSPRLVGKDGASQRVVWPFPSPVRAWLEALGLGSVKARQTYVVGSVLLLRWEAIQQIGLFDERFFLYAEEADWQRRAVDLGWSSRLCMEAIAVHAGAGTSDDPRRREALFHAGHETYIRKWHGKLGWQLYRAAVCLGAAARVLVLKGERRSEAARRALLYLRGPRRCARQVME